MQFSTLRIPKISNVSNRPSLNLQEQTECGIYCKQCANLENSYGNGKLVCFTNMRISWNKEISKAKHLHNETVKIKSNSLEEHYRVLKVLQCCQLICLIQLINCLFSFTVLYINDDRKMGKLQQTEQTLAIVLLLPYF